jgi:hypothetical protein
MNSSVLFLFAAQQNIPPFALVIITTPLIEENIDRKIERERDNLVRVCL